MATKTEATVRKVAESDVAVGLICADRDGNRIRIDSDRMGETSGTASGDRTLTYHFVNDELRVQEGIQERSLAEFLAEGWYMATVGKSL